MENSQPVTNLPTQMSPPESNRTTKEISPQRTRQELREAIIGSNEVLVTASTKLTLFPDTLSLDRAKLTVIKRNFFRSAEVVSIRIEDVLNITASVGPIFGVVEIASRVMSAGPYKIGKFFRSDATRFKRIAQGYTIALERNIECNALPVSELIELLDKIGEDDHVNSELTQTVQSRA